MKPGDTYEKAVNMASVDIITQIGIEEFEGFSTAVPAELIKSFHVEQTGGFTMVPTYYLNVMIDDKYDTFIFVGEGERNFYVAFTCTDDEIEYFDGVNQFTGTFRECRDWAETKFCEYLNRTTHSFANGNDLACFFCLYCEVRVVVGKDCPCPDPLHPPEIAALKARLDAEDAEVQRQIDIHNEYIRLMADCRPSDWRPWHDCDCGSPICDD